MEIKVQNITCGGCASKIEKALSQLEDVTVVSVDVATGVVNIEGDADQDEVMEVLDTLGFPVA